jgi:hypothetical protein
MKRIIALSLVCSFMFAHRATSQETVELPKLATTTIAPDVHVPDAGFVRHRSGPQKTSREILAASRVMDQQCSKTEVDGVITYDIIHDNKPLKMVIRPSGAIEITVVRMFDSRNANELRAEFPSLNTRLNAFPTKTDGNSRVRVNLEIETTYSFANAAKLKEKRIDLHRIYDRHTRPPLATWSK